LHGEIETERGERKAEDLAIRGALNDVNADLTGKINAESQARIAADTALDTKLSARIDTWEKEVTKLQGLMTTLQNQMTSLDTTVTTMLNTVSDIEVALNNVKTSIADIISGKTILPYVRLAGDTMTGVLNMGGNKITGLPGLQFVNGSNFNETNGKLQAVNGNNGVRVSGADAVDDNDFVTKKQLPVVTLATKEVEGITKLNEDVFMSNGVAGMNPTGLDARLTSGRYANFTIPAVFSNRLSAPSVFNVYCIRNRKSDYDDYFFMINLAVVSSVAPNSGYIVEPTLISIDSRDLTTEWTEIRYNVYQSKMVASGSSFTKEYKLLKENQLLTKIKKFTPTDELPFKAVLNFVQMPYISCTTYFLNGYQDTKIVRSE
jgi:hypothetical protein